MARSVPTFQGLRVYYLDEEEWRLARVDYAVRANWDNGQWVGTDAWRRLRCTDIQAFHAPALRLQGAKNRFAQHR